MKCLVYAAAAVLALASQATPALAFSTASPSFKLVPLIANTHLGVSGSGCNEDAGISGAPYFEMPVTAWAEDVSGIAVVKIDITSKGDLAAANLFSSSGNYWLDQAALRSARLTHYTPEVVNCEQVAGSYLYEVDF
jgi:TonB family protein